MKPQTRYTTARDGRVIAWTVMGDGPLDVLYVPASISAMEQVWEHPTVAAFFERLSSFCRLIVYDRRGSGMSESPGKPRLAGGAGRRRARGARRGRVRARRGPRALRGRGDGHALRRLGA